MSVYWIVNTTGIQSLVGDIIITRVGRYCFSGHESFICKAQWLKKGYDFVAEGNNFNDADAVVKLGVGKNMVSSIRFWLKAFGLTENDQLTPIAHYIFNTETGKDPYGEDITTLWILHYMLVSKAISSIYSLIFLELHREKKEFDREQALSFIRRKCAVPEQKNVFNENTVKKDIGVLLRSYIAPSSLKSIEDFSALLLPLNLISGKETYSFAEVGAVPDSILFFAIASHTGNDRTLSFDKLQELALLFCMPIDRFLIAVRNLAHEHSDKMVYTDNAGIRNVQFLEDVDPLFLIDQHYTEQR